MATLQSTVSTTRTSSVVRPLLTVLVIAIGLSVLLLVLAKLLEVIRLKPVLGYGDVQLFFASLLWIPIHRLSLFFILTGIVGLILALFFMRKRYFPLAPAIGVAWAICLIGSKKIFGM